MSTIHQTTLFNRRNEALAFFSLIFIVGLIGSCKSETGCSNGSDCDVIAGNTYTNSVTLGAITTTTTVTFNDNGKFDLSNTYSGSGAPANCSSSGTWSLSGQTLEMTTNSSDCEDEELYALFVYELVKNYDDFELTGRWMTGGLGNTFYKQTAASGWAGTYRLKDFAQPSTLTMTTSANPDSGTFQFTGDYTQSGTWVASYSTANFTGTAGTGWDTNFSLTTHSSTSYFTKQ